ncbi:MAG: complex I subunit 5 family protein [Bacillota bacterium]
MPNHGTVQSILPILAVLFPLLSAVAAGILGERRSKARDLVAAMGCLGAFLSVVLMYPALSRGNTVVYHLLQGVWPSGISFRVDFLGLLVGAVASLVWLASTIYAWAYMGHEGQRTRYYFFNNLTLAAMMGVSTAGDLLSLLLFFEALTFASYVLVVHREDQEARSAGNLYLFMGVFGGLCLITGMALQYYFGHTLALDSGTMHSLGTLKPLVASLLVLGFGIKAGMVPVHIWLPQAHPVAPSPASALLSGVMIKAGAYGIVRVGLMALEDGHGQGAFYEGLGLAVITTGLFTMIFGVFMALQSGNSKRMLAYHSISQMGYILMGAGVAAYLGLGHGAMGFGGAVYHIINHALFKAGLFLAVGVVYLSTEELDMYKLGGLWRNFPFTAAAMLIAAMGITGFPGLNGYASKTMLHHSIVEAAQHMAHTTGSMYLWWGEKVFSLTGVGTACSFIKLFGLTFLGKRPERFATVRGEPLPVKVGMGILCVVMLAIGLAPNLLVNVGLGPAATGVGYDHHFVDEYLGHLDFWYPKDVIAILITLALGLGLFTVGMRTGIFHLHFPKALSIEYCGRALAGSAVRGWARLAVSWQLLTDRATRRLQDGITTSSNLAKNIDYDPQSRTSAEFNLTNLDFDTLILVTVLGVFLALYIPLQVLSGRM